MRIVIDLTPEEQAAARLLLTAFLRALAEPEAIPVAPVDPCSRSQRPTQRGMISSGSLSRLVATPDKPPERPAPYVPEALLGLQYCKVCRERLEDNRMDGGACALCAWKNGASGTR